MEDYQKPLIAAQRITASLHVAWLLPASLLMAAEAESCEKATAELSIQHAETSGMSYPKRYTSLDYFLSYPVDKSHLLLDLRGHLLNGWQYAGNAGLGWRYAAGPGSQLGLNTFYDFRQEKSAWFQQIGVGAEWLTPSVDVRANGYLPLDQAFLKKGISSTLNPKHSHREPAYRDTKYRAFPVVEAEVGVPIAGLIYLAGGSYYTFAPENQRWSFGKALGLQARLDLDLGPYMKIGSIFSYDRIFKRHLQGQLDLRIPLGGSRKKGACGCHKSGMRDLQRQKIVRREIIPLLREEEARIEKSLSLIDEIENAQALIVQPSEIESQPSLEEEAVEERASNHRSEAMANSEETTDRQEHLERDSLGEQGLNESLLQEELSPLDNANVPSANSGMGEWLFEFGFLDEYRHPLPERASSERQGDLDTLSSLDERGKQEVAKREESSLAFSSDRSEAKEGGSNPNENNGVLDRVKMFLKNYFNF